MDKAPEAGEGPPLQQQVAPYSSGKTDTKTNTNTPTQPNTPQRKKAQSMDAVVTKPGRRTRARAAAKTKGISSVDIRTVLNRKQPKPTQEVPAREEEQQEGGGISNYVNIGLNTSIQLGPGTSGSNTIISSTCIGPIPCNSIQQPTKSTTVSEEVYLL